MEIKLRDWQKWVLEEIEQSFNKRTTEESLLSLSDYDLNLQTQIKIKLPIRSGHTYFTAYLSRVYDAALIIKDTEHWEEISGYRAEMDDGTPCSSSTVISVFELFYAIHYANSVNQPSRLLSNIHSLRNRISEQKIVVVDRSAGIPTAVEDFILSVARGPVIFLD